MPSWLKIQTYIVTVPHGNYGFLLVIFTGIVCHRIATEQWLFPEGTNKILLVISTIMA